jgi:cell division protein FtsI/penicillin-binding protein 2
MRPFALMMAFATAAALLQPIEASGNSRPALETAYLLLDAATGRVLDARWADPDQPVPIGSLIKPFTALAYAGTHGFTYPTLLCRGAADGCWLPSGHGRIGLADAVAGSCNAYFRQLAQRMTPDALIATLQWFGIRADRAAATPGEMVGLGDGLKLAPSALIRGYLELASRAGQPGVSPIVQGMMASARTGTGRAVGAAIGRTDALVKTGTAPCSHSPRASGDGYTVVVYPADRPRVVLLVQAHGRTGAETAEVAGRLLTHALGIR